MIASRPDKLTNAHTILFEIDMLRFAARRLQQGPFKSEKDLWAYLECFLLHFRNLIEFLGKEANVRPDDLHITRPQDFMESGYSSAERNTLNELHEQSKAVWREYESREDSISKYLHHCTVQRTVGKKWPVGIMNNAVENLLVPLEQLLRKRPQSWEHERRVRLSRYASNSTIS